MDDVNESMSDVAAVADLVAIAPESTVSRTILRAEGVRLVLFAFDTGEELTEHTAAMPVLLQTLGHPVGFYTSLVGPQNQFVHLWAYDSLADYEQRCRARDTHPDFPAYLQASAHLITAQETRLIRAVAMPG